jgi:DNA-binding CsgD family transcriptional regulator
MRFDTCGKFREAEPSWGGLSATETDVVRWTAMGKTAKEISALLDRCSTRSVEHHRQNAMHKLNAHNRAELIAMWAQRDASADK